MRVIVTGELPREAHNAPLHLFSASPGLVAFGRSVYQPRSATTSTLLKELFVTLREEGLAVYTMEDFLHNYAKKYFPKLTPEERRKVLEKLPPEERLAGLSAEQILASISEEQIRQILDRLAAGQPTERPQRRRKK